jgi:hypothetical protein
MSPTNINPRYMSREALIREVVELRGAAQARPARGSPPGGAGPRQRATVGVLSDVATETGSRIQRGGPVRRLPSPQVRLEQAQLLAEIAPKLRALRTVTDKLLRDLKQKKPRDLLVVDARNRLLSELQALAATLDALGWKATVPVTATA